MARESQIGTKRQVSGAHYGLRDWLAQRLSAVIMIAFTLILLTVFFTANHFSYEGWLAIFARPWMKLLTVVVALALGFHAWVGVRDIWMDYIRHTGVRLFLHSVTIVWLIGVIAYFIQILWSI